MSSSLLLFPHRFGRYVLRPSSDVCRTREPTRNFELRSFIKSTGVTCSDSVCHNWVRTDDPRGFNKGLGPPCNSNEMTLIKLRRGYLERETNYVKANIDNMQQNCYCSFHAEWRIVSVEYVVIKLITKWANTINWIVIERNTGTGMTEWGRWSTENCARD